MKRMKQALCLLLTSAMLACLCVGCGKSADKSKRIGISMPNDSEARWASDSEVLHDVLTQAGYEVNIQFAGNDSAAQAQQIQDMIGAGCTTIIVAAVAPDHLMTDLGLEDVDRQRISGGSVEDESEDEAHSPMDDGVNLIAYQTLLADSGIVDYYVGFDGYEAGYLQASCIEDLLSLADTTSSYTLELCFGDPNDPLTAFQYQGAMEVLQVYLDSGVLSIPSGQTSFEDVCSASADGAKARMEKLLSSTYAAGGLDAVLCGSDALASAVGDQLFVQYTGGVFPILTGQGCLEQNVNDLVSGRQAMTLLNDCTGMAEEAARVALALAAGEAVETEDSLDNGRINVPASLFYPKEVYADSISDLLVTPGYFTANEDGTYSSATGYTATISQPAAQSEDSGAASSTSSNSGSSNSASSGSGSQG